MATEIARDRFRKCRPDNTYGVPKFLNLNRKVFLSHSSGDKKFVWLLHDQLCNRYRDAIAFFDVVTLPKAKPVSMKNILEEAKISQLGVLVLSEDFFMRTRNPMLELLEFEASKVRLLPLFFEISIAQFKDESRRATWESQWEKWAAGDKAVVEKWIKALDYVNRFDGLEFDKVAKSQHEYIHEIVKKVTHIVDPAFSFGEEGVYGMDRLYKIVEGMYEDNRKNKEEHCKRNDKAQAASACSGVRVEESLYAADVVGVYGFAGLGKTTLCKSLCDKYFAEFNGRVCHIDLGSRPSYEDSFQTHSSESRFQRMKYILTMLIGCTTDGQHLAFSQGKNPFHSQIFSMVDPVFLAIDNVLGEKDSQEEAKLYLNLAFPKGSKIFLTSRSKDILESLASNLFGRSSIVINHIPGLELQEARNIFLHEMPKVPGVPDLQKDEVDGLVNICCIHRDRAWYHPYMIKSLAASIKWSRKLNLDWKGRLEKLRQKGIVDKNDAWMIVYKVLDISYALLEVDEAKTLFLDLLLFCSATQDTYRFQDWVKCVYSHLGEENIDNILLQLQDLFFIRKGAQPPDLLVDFAKYKALKVKGTGIDPHYLVVDGTPCPQNIRGHVRHLSISRCEQAKLLDLRIVQGLEVLHLVDNAGLQEVRLGRTTCATLRSLIVRVPPGISLHVTMDEDLSMSAADQQCSTAICERPPVWAQLAGNLILPTLRRSSFLESHAQSLLLQRFEITAAPVLDLGCLGNLLNLEVLRLQGLPSVQAIDVTTCARLKTLQIFGCEGLLALTIPNSSGLHSRIDHCASLERLSLCTTLSNPEAGSSSHGSVDICRCPTLCKIDGLIQYAGDFECSFMEPGAANLEGTFGDWLKLAGTDSSICKAKIDSLRLSGVSQGLASLTGIIVVDAQHIWLFLGPLFEAQSTCHLEILTIECKKDGDCGCDKVSPSLPRVSRGLRSAVFLYRCSQVRDLSSVAQWDALRQLVLRGCVSLEVLPDFKIMTSLQDLNLSGCTSVKKLPEFATMNSLRTLNLSGCKSLEVLPDFSTLTSVDDLDLSGCTSLKVLPDFLAMTSLQYLNLSRCTSLEVSPNFATMTSLRQIDLSHTSLKEWPVGVLCLPRLNSLDLTGCRQLPAEELIKVIVLEQGSKLSMCGECALGTLMFDLRSGERDRWSIMDALDSHFHELCQRGRLDSWHCSIQVIAWIIMLLYDFWFNDGYGSTAGDCCEGSPSEIAVQKMRRLLCSEFVTQWFPSYLRSRGVEGLKDPYMAFALMGIAVVGAASIGWYNADMNDSLKDGIISFLKSGSSSTELQQDHLYFQLRWSESSFRPLHSCPELLRTRVPKLRERVGEGARKMMAGATDEVQDPDFISALEAALLSGNFLQYDLRWLFNYYMERTWVRKNNRAAWEPSLREYYNLLGEGACQTVYEKWMPHNLQWQEAVVKFCPQH